MMAGDIKNGADNWPIVGVGVHSGDLGEKGGGGIVASVLTAA